MSAADAQHPTTGLPKIDTEAVRAEPTAGQRVSRTAGQGGGVLVLVQLWQAFGWLGASSWTAEQAAARWPAITAALVRAGAGAQTAFNWWRGRAEVAPSPPRG